jgi:tripartite-type tricarboxylate transporter receptor subunit TctC
MGHPLQSLNTVACALSATCFAGAAMPATAADWKPERAVEFVVPAPAGGALDGPARVVQKIWQELKLVDVPVNIINRSGGGQTVGATYVQQAANDAHRLLLISGPLLSNHITGRSKLHYTDFTILGQLFTEYNALSVNADGAIRTVNDLIARLKPAPQIAYWDGVLRKTSPRRNGRKSSCRRNGWTLTWAARTCASISTMNTARGGRY